MVISTVWSRRSYPQYVAPHPGETLPPFGRAPYFPWQDILTPQAGALTSIPVPVECALRAFSKPPAHQAHPFLLHPIGPPHAPVGGGFRFWVAGASICG